MDRPVGPIRGVRNMDTTYREKLKNFVIKTTLIILKMVFLHNCRLHQLAHTVYLLSSCVYIYIQSSFLGL